MPLTRGEAVGYDADLMAFKFTMRNGEQIVQCQISNAALGDLAGRWRGAARDLPAEFEAHRELIEAIASEQFDQTSNEETRLVRIFSKHMPTAQRKSNNTFQDNDPEDAFGEDKGDHRTAVQFLLFGCAVCRLNGTCSKKVNKSST